MVSWLSCFWVNGATGRLSTTKLWRNVANVIATIVILYNIHTVSWDMLLAYVGIISGTEVAKRALDVKRALTSGFLSNESSEKPATLEGGLQSKLDSISGDLSLILTSLKSSKEGALITSDLPIDVSSSLQVPHLDVYREVL